MQTVSGRGCLSKYQVQWKLTFRYLSFCLPFFILTKMILSRTEADIPEPLLGVLGPEEQTPGSVLSTPLGGVPSILS